MSRRFRFCCAAVVGVVLFASGANAAGVNAVFTFTNLAAFKAATASITTIGFNGILPPGTAYEDFNPLGVNGATFSTPIPQGFVNVTTADFYSPTNYPADFIIGAATGSPNSALNVTLASPVYAIALDYGQYGTGTGVITFSNGFVYTPPTIPGEGSTTFLGVVSTSPITGFSYDVTGGDYVVLDVLLSNPAPGLVSSILWGLANGAITGPTPCTAGDPISCATGNLVETAPDLSVRGRGRSLHMVRTYNSQDAASALAPDAAGFGWTHSYAESLTFDASGNATVQQGNGSTVPFTASGAVFTAPSFVIATLVKNANGTYTFTLPDQTADIFSSTGQLMVQTDRNGYQTNLAYNGSGQLVTVTDPAGRTLTFTYGSNGLVSSVTDPIARKVTYAYDASNNLIAATDAGGNITHYTYDASHQLLTMTDPNGGIASNTYDSNNRVVSQTDPAGRTTTFAYAGTTTTVTDGNGNVESQTYTGNRLTSLIRGVGSPAPATWTFTNDAAGNVISTTDPNGHTWTATYDTHGNKLTSTDSLGRTTTSTYDAQNNLLTRIDPLGVTTTMTYNGLGDLTTISRPLTGTSQVWTTTFQYEDTSHPGDVTGQVDALGNVSAMTYDSDGDLVQLVDPDGDKWTGSYNQIGWLTSEVTQRGNVAGGNPRNFTVTRVYSPLGELLSMTDRLGNVTTFTYDGNQNQLTLTDPLHHTTMFAYDADNERIKVTRADGGTLQSGFDNAGNLISQTNGIGKVTSYSYDALNRRTQATDPLSRTTQYHYDGANNLTTITDAASETTTLTYDAANELTKVAYSDGKTLAVTYTYDLDGQRTGMTDGTGNSAYQYDSLHRLIGSVDGAGNHISYSHDLRGDLTGLTYPSGKQVTRGYDAMGRLTSVADWLGHTSHFQYDADGDLASINYGNGTTGAYTYDQDDFMTAVTYAHGSQQFLAFDYVRNALEQVSAATGGATGTTNYSYNSVNELTGENQTALNYDDGQDITQLYGATMTYDAANEMLTSSGGSGGAATLTYDARGNRLRDAGPGVANTYQYDQVNRLVAYSSHATYAYNGDGLRMSKTVSGDAENFAWDLSQGMPMLLADGMTQFIYGPNGRPLEQVSASGAVLWLHQDQLGSTRALTNQQGKLEETYNYNAYGERLGLGVVGGSNLPSLTPLLYVGQYTDAESGLQYFHARYYHPSTGQFLTRDPLAAATREPYRYASGDPVNLSDPTGLDEGPGWGYSGNGSLNQAPSGYSAAPSTQIDITASQTAPAANLNADFVAASVQAAAAANPVYTGNPNNGNTWLSNANAWADWSAQQAATDLSADSAYLRAYYQDWASYYASFSWDRVYGVWASASNDWLTNNWASKAAQDLSADSAYYRALFEGYTGPTWGLQYTSYTRNPACR